MIYLYVAYVGALYQKCKGKFMSIFTRKRGRDQLRLSRLSRRPPVPSDVLDAAEDELDEALERNFYDVPDEGSFIIGYREGFRAGLEAFR